MQMLSKIKDIETRTKCGHRQALYKCECGNYVIRTVSRVNRNKTKSCGCKRDIKTHGATGTPTYKVWEDMKSRCNNKNNRSYKNYGGRGIKICDRWNIFGNFLNDMGEKPSGYTIDRIDNDKGYSPENCRWATPKEQCNNTRRCRKYTFYGVTLTISQWEDVMEVRKRRIGNRILRGANPFDAIFNPSNNNPKGKENTVPYCVGRKAKEICNEN